MQGVRRRQVALLVYAAVTAAAVFVVFFWLMWKTVPSQEGIFAARGVHVPPPTIAVFRASSIFIRFVPFAVLGGTLAAVVAAALLGALVAGKRLSPATALAWTTGVLLAFVLVGTVATGVALWALHRPIALAIERLDQGSRPSPPAESPR